MNDQGEKIIFLARELLNAGLPEIPAKKKAITVTMTFKTLCLTAVLAASGGAAVANWTQAYNRPLNRYEKIEIQALVFYAAKVKGVDEDTVRRDIERQTGIPHLDDMTASEFAAARRYLQDKAQ